MIVSSSGFSRGAIEVAARHNIALRVVKEIIEDAPTRETREEGEALHIRGIRLLDPGGTEHHPALDDRQKRHAKIRVANEESQSRS